MLHQKLSQKRVDQKRGFSLWHYKNQGNSPPQNRVLALYFLTLGASKNASCFVLQNSSKKGPLRFAQGFPLFLAPRGDLWGFPRAPKRAQKAPGRPPGASQKTLSIFGGQKDPLRSCAVLLGGSLGLLGGPWGPLGAVSISLGALGEALQQFWCPGPSRTEKDRESDLVAPLPYDSFRTQVCTTTFFALVTSQKSI